MHTERPADIQAETQVGREFAKRVYAIVRKIPRGHVATYKMVSIWVGCGSPRAVGQALRRNPFAPQVPCHRVIASDLTIGGFKGCRAGPAIAEKVRMLAKEGVHFERGKLKDLTRIARRKC